jgi:hypothetical protein
MILSSMCHKGWNLPFRCLNPLHNWNTSSPSVLEEMWISSAFSADNRSTVRHTNRKSLFILVPYILIFNLFASFDLLEMVETYFEKSQIRSNSSLSINCYTNSSCHLNLTSPHKQVQPSVSHYNIRSLYLIVHQIFNHSGHNMPDTGRLSLNVPLLYPC